MPVRRRPAASLIHRPRSSAGLFGVLFFHNVAIHNALSSPPRRHVQDRPGLDHEILGLRAMAQAQAPAPAPAHQAASAQEKAIRLSITRRLANAMSSRKFRQHCSVYTIQTQFEPQLLFWARRRLQAASLR